MARNKDAIALLEKSVMFDPGYAPAWLALGLHYSDEADFGSGGEEMHYKTRASYERSHQLHPTLFLPPNGPTARAAFYGALSVSFSRGHDVARKWLRRC